MKVLASELVERMTIDQATHNRRAKSLVVHFRGSLNASHLKNWEAGRTAELTGEQSRQTSMPSSKPGSAPHVDTVLEAAMRLFWSGLPNAMPCTSALRSPCVLVRHANVYWILLCSAPVVLESSCRNYAPWKYFLSLDIRPVRE